MRFAAVNHGVIQRAGEISQQRLFRRVVGNLMHYRGVLADLVANRIGIVDQVFVSQTIRYEQLVQACDDLRQEHPFLASCSGCTDLGRSVETVAIDVFYQRRALAGDIDVDEDRRNLQLEAAAQIEKIKLPNTKIKLLQQLLAKAISDFKKVNKAKGVDFSKQFKLLVDRYNERKEDDVLVSNVLDDFTDEIIDLLQALKKEKESYADLGIDFQEKAFYDILKGLAIKYDFTYPEDKLVTLAKAVKLVVDDKAKYPDWNKRVNIRAELKVDLILVLAEHKYPPVDRDEVYKEIFEQAENFKKYQQA